MKKLIFVTYLILFTSIFTFIPALCLLMENPNQKAAPLAFIFTGIAIMVGLTKLIKFKA